MVWADPKLVPVMERLLDGPGAKDVKLWATELLDTALRIPGEHHGLAGRAAEMVLATPGIDSRLRCWSTMTAETARTHRDLVAKARACSELAAAGDPVRAAVGLAGIARDARQRGLRTAGELIYLSLLLVTDLIENRGGKGLFMDATAGTGTEPGRAVIAQAWSLTQDPEAFARHLCIQAENEEFAGPSTGAIAAGLRAAGDCILASQRYPADLQWARGRALYGIAFAIAPRGAARFETYLRYAQTHDVDLNIQAALTERWAQIILMGGRWSDALAKLQDIQQQLTVPDHARAMSTILRAIARAWRIGGDFERALLTSDEAVELIDRAGSELAATQQAGIWHNRAAILVELERNDEAYEAAARALAGYQADRLTAVGRAESEAMLVASDPDRSRAAERARALIEQDLTEPLPAPVRVDGLSRFAEVLAPLDPELALIAFQRAISASEPARRATVLAPLRAARALSKLPEELIPADADPVSFARQAITAASSQHNRLLGAQAKLTCARLLATDPSAHPEALSIGSDGLEDLTVCIGGLTASSGSDILRTVRPDLIALFDLAVEQDNGHLALRVAEVGRSIRLMAMLRMDLDNLPDDVRAAFAQIAAAELAAQGDSDLPTDPTVEGTRELRATALASRADASTDLGKAYGQVFRALSTAPPLDPAAVRDRFPEVHILTLHELDGIVRWTWWPPHTPAPLCGQRTLGSRVVRLIGAYTDGSIQAVPGDPVASLTAVLPEELVEFLTDEPEHQIDLLVAMTGRVWHIPLLAVPIGPHQAPLITRARVSVVPSLTMAVHVAETVSTACHNSASPATVAGYCNPQMTGAQTERRFLEDTWPSFRLLDQVEQLSTPVDLTVAATHADNLPGLQQSLHDHNGGRLSAARCLPQSFSPIVVLGACHGFRNIDAHSGNEEPIGLLTVIGARGAIWVVGGHQRLRDQPIGWILGRTYSAMAANKNIHDALRAAQLEYLSAVTGSGTSDLDLQAVIGDVQDRYGSSAPSTPWCWALTIVGPPPLSTWQTSR
ncbi:CHAT domain-containing protein [Nocardia sp. NPDC019255]|uniref:CHAT domain-containing protein n=1 Tax=Nocardia sp. NPDC019255 TaxID=3154591 RepID=UPI0033CC18EB